MLKTFELCPKKFYLRFIKNINMPANDEIFELGKNIHAIASYYLKNEFIDEIESSIGETIIPNIIRLNYEIAVPDLELPFCRENIFVRDDYTCQYCGKHFPASELTLDHVYPKSRFGPDIWENIVACCERCNSEKGALTPEEYELWQMLEFIRGGGLSR